MSNDKVAATFSGETTGEHTKAKLTDNPYQYAVDPKDVPPAPLPDTKHRVFYMPHEDRHDEALSFGMMQDYAETDVRLTNEMADRLHAELYPQPTPKRSRMLTPTEVIMALLIIGAIVAGFIFTVFVIKIW